MKEVQGDLFRATEYVLCITTNGTVKKNGEAVMGKGVAAQARARWPGLAALLGSAIREGGNHLHYLEFGDFAILTGDLAIITFPVKHVWWEKADLNLIRRSARELVALAEREGFPSVALPRPGCGSGNLEWARVKPSIAPILDDRFVVYAL